MEFPFKDLVKLSKQFNNIQKYAIDMLVDIQKTSHWVNGELQSKYHSIYSKIHFENFGDLYNFAKYEYINPIGMKLDAGDNQKDTYKYFMDKLAGACQWESDTVVRTLNSSTGGGKSTVKLLPDTLLLDCRPKIIVKDPIEFTDDGHTYRVLTGVPAGEHGVRILLAAREDEPVFDYLDKNNLIMLLPLENSSGIKQNLPIVSTSYDINTSHVFALCSIQPELTELLRDSVFINPDEAELLKLKMIKKLNFANKAEYLRVAATIDEDYRKNTTLVVIGKLRSSEIQKTSIRDILFTKTTATYENITIEAPNLLDVMYAGLDFNGEFDIYSVIQLYARHTSQMLKAISWTPAEEVAIKDGDKTQRIKFIDEFKINGISIKPGAAMGGQQYINNVRINQDEIQTVLSRASCYRSAESYELFLKSISRMSIRRHDIVANGLPVKIHATISRDEYDTPTPSSTAPSLRFVIDSNNKNINLVVDKDRNVPIKLGELIKKVDSLNARTNNRQYRDPVTWHYHSKNYVWCASELVKILADCTTFKEKQEDGSEKTTRLITEDDIRKILNVIDEHNKAKIERSKQFLATAVKITNAEEITFKGKKAYMVKGALRTYAVLVENAKVYDYETQQYRCIVNDRHYKGAGYDDIASRLLALKNDSVMQHSINTLRGQAQPNAENAHNDYSPERDTGSIVDKIMETAFQPAN